MPVGNYKIAVYKTGYHANDAYSIYCNMGSPSQLTKQQVETRKQENNGKPVASYLVNSNKNVPIKPIAINENDVFFIDVQKL